MENNTALQQPCTGKSKWLISPVCEEKKGQEEMMPSVRVATVFLCRKNGV